MRRAVAGALQLALVRCIVGGLSLPAVYLVGSVRGKAAAVSERNAHWQALIDRMQADARAALLAHDADTKRVHAAGREHDRLRDELAAAAAGGVAEADDSVAACRARADAIGQLLGEALRTSSACAVDAEDLAAGARALRQYARRVHELSQESAP